MVYGILKDRGLGGLGPSGKRRRIFGAGVPAGFSESLLYVIKQIW